MTAEYRVPRLELQLFAEDKTEKPTPRRRQEARKKGHVFKSVEFTSAVVLLVGYLVLKLIVPPLAADTGNYLRALAEMGPVEIGPEFLATLTASTLAVVARGIIPLGIATFLCGMLVNFAQVGLVFNVHSLTPDLSKMNPVTSLGRLMSKRVFFEMGKAALKVLIVGYVCYTPIKARAADIPLLFEVSLRSGLSFLGETLSAVFLRASVVLVILAAADYLYQRWEYESRLRMTRTELKEEMKQTEGDPLVRSRIRRRQRQMASARMMRDVKKASVVITNPTHYAVAIVYDIRKMAAPMVVAKGRGFIAKRIISIAESERIPVVENPPLAQALYWAVEVGGYIPEALYKAVAEVLAFVYRLQVERGKKGLFGVSTDGR